MKYYETIFAPEIEPYIKEVEAERSSEGSGMLDIQTPKGLVVRPRRSTNGLQYFESWHIAQAWLVHAAQAEVEARAVDRDNAIFYRAKAQGLKP